MVAVEDGQLVGWVHYIFHRSTISIAPTCYLQDLFTRESIRGKGFGRKLINAVYEQGSSLVCRAFVGKLRNKLDRLSKALSRSR
jgi:GNAT superfamily N-acetyltransferase